MTPRKPNIQPPRTLRVRNQDRYILSMMIVGSTLTIIGVNFVQFGLNILKLPYFCIAFGIGLSISAFVASICTKISIKNPAKTKAKQIPQRVPEKENLVNAPEKKLTTAKHKKMTIPMLVKMKRAQVKKTLIEKLSSHISKLFSSLKSKKVALPEIQEEIEEITDEKIPHTKKKKRVRHRSAHHKNESDQALNIPSTHTILFSIEKNPLTEISEISEEDSSEADENHIAESKFPESIDLPPQTSNQAFFKLNTPVEKKEDLESPISSPIESKSFFNPSFSITDANKNLFIDRDRFPTLLLKFAEHFYNVTQQHLKLTGGSVTDLMCGIDKFNDFDCVAFKDKNELLNILKEAKQIGMQYHYKLIAKKSYPIIKIILAAENLPVCRLIYLPESDENNFLNYPIHAKAAYIRTQNSLYYVNKNDNTCIEIKCSDRVTTDSNCNTEMLQFFDKELRIDRNPYTILSLDQLHHISTLTGHNHAELIEMDISCYQEQQDTQEASMKKILAQRDFKSAALYTILDSTYKIFILKGFSGAISSINRERISAVNLPTLFHEEGSLLRIFRLAKIRLKNPTFKEDQELLDHLAIIDLKKLFDNFIFKPSHVETNKSENIIHLSQINTKLNELFAKFDVASAINIMIELKIISSMTGIDDTLFKETSAELADYMAILPKYAKKTAFYYFVYMHYSLLPDDQHKKLLINKVKLTLEPSIELPAFKKHIAFIDITASNRMTPTNYDFKPDAAFSSMLSSIKQKKREKQNLGLESTECNTPRNRVHY